MKLTNKTTTSIVFFMILFYLGCSTSNDNGVANYRSTPSELDCINYIIAKDDSLGQVRNHACENRPLSNTIENYVNAINKLDFTDCPKDFALAFKKHMDAWVKMKRVTDHFLNLRGEMHQLFDIIAESDQKEQFDPLLKDIWDTWGNVENAQKASANQ